MPERISSLDPGYETGDLSVYPEAIDDKTTLYEVANNAETRLKAALPYNGKYLIVDDTSAFPSQGLIRVGAGPGDPRAAELIYYGEKTGSIFKSLVRGFAGSRQNQWDSGAWVTNAVTAEPHNAVKDAILNLQQHVGLLENPDEASLHGRLKALETRFLSPKALFRAYPRKGPPSLTVRFQNYSEGPAIRYLWDFGDGTQSIEKNPSHTYVAEGLYTVKLNIITSLGAQGVTTKTDYIFVSESERIPFFYVVQEDANQPPYSQQTADEQSADPAVWKFVDQTDGNIKQRYWVFGDGEAEAVTDPFLHVTTHVYAEPGEYSPSLLIVYDNEKLQRVFLTDESITVT